MAVTVKELIAALQKTVIQEYLDYCGISEL